MFKTNTPQKTHNENEREDGTKRPKLQQVDKMQNLLNAMKDSSTEAGLTRLKFDDDFDMWKEAKLILERKCYITALDTIADKFLNRDKNTEPVHTITGTPGIGKTTFRFWILLLWVQNSNKFLMGFSTILFSNGDKQVYTITRKDDSFSVSCADYDQYVFEGKSRSRFGVLEMPKELPIADKQLFGMEVLILTGSPSRFKQGCEILKDNTKLGSVCLPLWTWDEINCLPIQNFSLEATDETEKRKELNYKFKQFGGVLQFLVKPFKEAEGLVTEALENVTIDFIQNVLTGTPPQGSNISIHRLVALDGKYDYKVKGFISECVFDKCVQYVANQQRLTVATYIKGLSEGAKRCFFKAMFYRDFKEESGMVIKYEVGNQVKELTILTDSSYTSDNLLDSDILYRPTKAYFHGLDFFCIKKAETPEKYNLFMLQTTVSDNGHNSLNLNHPDIKNLLKDVKAKFSIKSCIVIYVLPYKKRSFTIPDLDNPNRSDCVYKGY